MIISGSVLLLDRRHKTLRVLHLRRQRRLLRCQSCDLCCVARLRLLKLVLEHLALQLPARMEDCVIRLMTEAKTCKESDICQVNVFALYSLGTANLVLASVDWIDFGVLSSDSKEIETCQ